MKKILVVDDDKSIRLVLSTALTRSGFLVKTSATAAGFWGLLNTEKFDIMITDVGLKNILDIAIKAPVFPAETSASASPDLTSCIAIPIDEFLPFLTATLGFSFCKDTNKVFA